MERVNKIVLQHGAWESLKDRRLSGFLVMGVFFPSEDQMKNSDDCDSGFFLIQASVVIVAHRESSLKTGRPH